MRHLLAIGALSAMLVTGAAAQDTNAARGAAQGADAGAQVLGPVGAVVGGVTGAAVGGAADIAGAVTAPLAPAPSTVKRTTCITNPDGSRRCDSIETTN